MSAPDDASESFKNPLALRPVTYVAEIRLETQFSLSLLMSGHVGNLGGAEWVEALMRATRI